MACWRRFSLFISLLAIVALVGAREMRCSVVGILSRCCVDKIASPESGSGVIANVRDWARQYVGTSCTTSDGRSGRCRQHDQCLEDGDTEGVPEGASSDGKQCKIWALECCVKKAAPSGGGSATDTSGATGGNVATPDVITGGYACTTTTGVAGRCIEQSECCKHSGYVWERNRCPTGSMTTRCCYQGTGKCVASGSGGGGGGGGVAGVPSQGEPPQSLPSEKIVATTWDTDPISSCGGADATYWQASCCGNQNVKWCMGKVRLASGMQCQYGDNKCISDIQSGWVTLDRIGVTDADVSAAGVSVDSWDVFQKVSLIESNGKLGVINTWDDQIFTYGAFQFSCRARNLALYICLVKNHFPTEFAAYLAPFGFDCSDFTLTDGTTWSKFGDLTLGCKRPNTASMCTFDENDQACKAIRADPNAIGMFMLFGNTKAHVISMAHLWRIRFLQPTRALTMDSLGGKTLGQIIKYKRTMVMIMRGINWMPGVFQPEIKRWINENSGGSWDPDVHEHQLQQHLREFTNSKRAGHGDQNWAVAQMMAEKATYTA